jgi:transposase
VLFISAVCGSSTYFTAKRYNKNKFDRERINKLLCWMTTEELFSQILGIHELTVTHVSDYSDRYEISVCSILKQGLCRKCGKKCEKVKSYFNRMVQDLPISGKSVILNLEVRQFECECGSFFTENFVFVRPNKHLTIRYEDYLYIRCKGVDLMNVAQKEHLDWRTVDEIFQTYSANEVKAHSNWEKITHIAIDEIALKKGHNNYVVVILDLISGQILDILKQRDKDFLVQYFQDKGSAFCKQIQVFCSDMWKAYLNCAEQVFPNAIIVADRFHFFGKCQEGMEHARNSFRKQYPEAEELKKLKWALLKDPENLTVKEQEKLKNVFEKKDFQLLRLTWDARNTLRDIFNCPLDLEQAEILIDQWIQGVEKYKIRYFFKFVAFYKTWKKVILNYFKGRFSTGKLEGTNNKLKLIKRRAFGFLNFDHFRLRAIVEFY